MFVKYTKHATLIFIGVLIFLSGVFGYLLGKNIPLNNKLPLDLLTEPNTDFSAFTYASAELRGQIIDLNKNLITIKNNRGQTLEFGLAKNVLINKPKQTPYFATPSASLAGIDLNQDVLVTLELSEYNKLIVTSLIFQPEPADD